MARVIILMMDSLGIGFTEDAYKYGDEGSNTLHSIFVHCQEGHANKDGIRNGPLKIHNLEKLGLLAAMEASRTSSPPQNIAHYHSKFGYAKELSYGKDTPSGHWEIAGVPVLFDWGYFPKTVPTFPEELISKLCEIEKLPGILGNCHASGTEIIKQYGAEHLDTGKPIIYTSADSVFQIAAHEESFGLEKLYSICLTSRKLVDDYNIGRVIARPFTGTNPNSFIRTGNRRDYSTPPPSKTVLDYLTDQTIDVISIGKIADIYAHSGISHKIKATGNKELFDKTLDAMDRWSNNSLIFTNFVDFDMLYGHRRDVIGYAKALEDFDSWLPKLQNKLHEDDLVIITADHGCDPAWEGSDHTREHIPVIAFGPKVKPEFIGKRESFADIGQSIAHYFNLNDLEYGQSFI